MGEPYGFTVHKKRGVLIIDPFIHAGRPLAAAGFAMF
jgi:hypothetical protein